MNFKHKLLKPGLLLLVLFSFLIGQDAWAATKTASVSGLWSNAATWGGVAAPTLADDVIINPGVTVTVAAAEACKSLSVNDGALVINDTRVLTIHGNVALTGTSSLSMAPAAVAGGVTFATATTKTLSVSSDSYFSVINLTVADGIVNTASDFSVTGVLACAAGTTFEATAGTATFSGAVGTTLWDKNAAAVLKLYNVLLNLAGAEAPATGITVAGDFTKIGAGTFTASAGTIVFENADPVGKNIQLVGGATTFYGLAIGSAPFYQYAKVKTSSDFTIANKIEVIKSSSFIAEAGTITMNSTAGTNIVNSADGVLKFNHLNIGDVPVTAAVTTASNFTINGNLVVGGDDSFTATNGTVTFENNLERSITNNNPTDNTLVFNTIAVANDSKLKTTTNMTIGTGNPGGISVGTNASFTANSPSVIIVDGVSTKTFVNNDSLKFYDLTIANTGSNIVTTATDFTVGHDMIYAATGNNPKFDATGGTVTFTGATPTITSAGTNPMSFYNLRLDGGAVSLVAAQLISIKKDLVLDNGASFGVADATPTVSFIGAENSQIRGSSTVDPAATFGILYINKTAVAGSNEVQLFKNTTIMAAGALSMDDGILNLGSTTFISGATTLPNVGTAGFINGGTGTYEVSTGHITTAGNGLKDTWFRIGSNNTLYNLTIGVAHEIGGNLTINGDLDWSAIDVLTLPTASTLTLYGNLKQSKAGTISGAADATIIFKGTGSAVKLDNAILAARPSLNFERGEVLTGDLTMPPAATLTINSSVNALDISTNTLTLDATTVLSLISGNIKADAGTVALGTHTSQTTIPANLFTSNTIKNLTLGNAEYTLGSDLTITTALAQATVNNLYTNDNTLTLLTDPLTPANLPSWVAGDNVVGNVKKKVTSTATVFNVGDGTANGYAPLTLAFANLGSELLVKVSSTKQNPVYGRVGDPTKAINCTWNIETEGTTPNDSLKMVFTWGTDYNNGIAANFVDNLIFPAKWNTSSWRDYRNTTKAGGAYAAQSLTMTAPSAFAVDPDSLAGAWTIFAVATAGTPELIEANKDAAVATAEYKLAITNITPNPVEAGAPFSVTLQLQDKYGNPYPVPADGPYQVTFTNVLGTVIPPVAVIPVGSSTVVVNGFTYAAAGTGYQMKAEVSDPNSPKLAPIAAISAPINVVGSLPSEQVSNFTLTASSTTMIMDFDLTAGNAVILAKAGSAITSDEFPVDGTTYYPSSNFGQGSAIGNAVAVYKGLSAGAPVTISGLTPGETYYFRGFAYTGTTGTEKYATYSSAGNPKSKATTGTTDDDAEFGPNNSRTTAKPIGTNTVVRGTIRSAADEDWFSFAVTSISPNIRARLYDLPGNYTLELYDMTGRRIRRSTLNGTSNEALIANALPAGTYTVRILSADGSAFVSPGDEYYLKVTTSGSEIFSVTP